MAQIIFIPLGGGGGGGGPGEVFQWNANGDLPAFDPQAGSFNGFLSSNALLAGPGPFDGQRQVQAPQTIAALRVTQRVPSTVPSTTTVEFYRIRAGVVTTLGTVSLNNTVQFQANTAAPASAGLLAADVLFVSFAAIPGLDAADFSCWLELV